MNIRAIDSCSHFGARRDQQDRVAHCRNESGDILLVVSDGVGGQAGGEQASEAVVETALAYWENRQHLRVAPKDFLAQVCREAHERIGRLRKKDPTSGRATLAAIYVSQRSACWIHSGDSRVYIIRESGVIERTRDHSVLQILREKGNVQEEEMGTHPDQGKLLQSLGGEEYQNPDIDESPISDGDGFLVCTDGFWEHVTFEELTKLVRSTHGSLRGNLQTAAQRSCDRGGAKADNIAVAVATAIRQRRGVNVPLVLVCCVSFALLIMIAAMIWVAIPHSK